MVFERWKQAQMYLFISLLQRIWLFRAAKIVFVAYYLLILKLLINVKTRMDSQRQLKVSRLIQKELGEIFQRETRLLFGNALITVTQVRVSPDLGVAKVYVSLFNVPDTQALLASIKEHTKDIRTKLSDRIKKQVRIIPNLSFFLDDSLDYALRIDELLKK